jgi:hypothetical protein
MSSQKDNHKMVSVPIYLFELIVLIGGLAVGILEGSRLGIIGAFAGGILGLLLGRILGRLPAILVMRMMKRSFRGKTVDELRADLRSPDCLTPNCILLELSSRGEDIRKELDVVLALLESEDYSKRGFGWAALNSAFPDMACMISDYPMDGSLEERKKRTAKLRGLAEPSIGGDGKPAPEPGFSR